MLKFVIIGGVALLLLGAWRIAYWTSVRLVKNRIKIFCEEGPSLELFEERAWFGVFGIRLVKQASKIGKQINKSTSETVPEKIETQNILTEKLELRIPRWPDTALKMQKFITLIIAGKEKTFEFIPVIASHKGTFHLAKVEREETISSQSAKNKKKKKKKPLRFFDFVVTIDNVGTIVSSHGAFRKKEVHPVLPPKNGHIGGLQIVSGDEVDVGDVIMLLLVEVS